MTAPTQASTTRSANQSETEHSKWIDRGFIWGTRIFALAVAGVLLWIAVQVLMQALPAIREYGLGFLVDSTWDPVDETYGALPMIYGTLVSSAIALLLAIPIGLGTAIFLSEDFLPLSIRMSLVFVVELIAAIPSVVYGLWGIFVLIPFLQPIGTWLHNNLGWIPLFRTPYTGTTAMFPAALVLTVMILPILTTISRDSLASLPPDLRQASMGMGATRWTTIFRVLIPAAFSGIVGGTMLALGRAMGETLAVTMLIGNSIDIHISILEPANTISALIANQFAEARGLQEAALMYAGFILFLLTLIVNIFAELIIRKVQKY